MREYSREDVDKAEVEEGLGGMTLRSCLVMVFNSLLMKNRMDL